jgi:hypothetical protein
MPKHQHRQRLLLKPLCPVLRHPRHRQTTPFWAALKGFEFDLETVAPKAVVLEMLLQELLEALGVLVFAVG